MILADTSIWIDHFRKQNSTLVRLIDERAILCHPFVIGEMATGNIGNRNQVLRALNRLPKATAARDDEVLRLIEEERLFALGVGYIDLHLLASARLTPEAALWTHDKRLAAAAQKLNLSFP